MVLSILLFKKLEFQFNSILIHFLPIQDSTAQLMVVNKMAPKKVGKLVHNLVTRLERMGKRLISIQRELRS